MKIHQHLRHLCPLIATLVVPSISHAQNVRPAPNGIEYPPGLTNWRVIGTSIRNDNNTQRVILGNSIAIRAARAKTDKLHWPEGAILAKLVWKNETLATWKAATVPGDFMHAEIMVRDTKKYSATKGWGYARWTGLDLKPHGQNSSFVETCANCHKAAQNTAFVFTQPARLP
ncbi:MAG: cytochrome P460 family protein [Gammaproteobacteria bacterium]|nr:cytochrome P460 family protein [Gammaproteobacteria bacterium]MBT5827195.1 cytochrome P460 family protein [Gammaproteobacteria bacterium]MBT6418801.1 cytochrome P460 family protein [Gammaproteobacteria bacterium]MBT6575549.1 cytochrome P460 family protein [Gammaproteobacteria bacterium]